LFLDDWGLLCGLLLRLQGYVVTALLRLRCDYGVTLLRLWCVFDVACFGGGVPRADAAFETSQGRLCLGVLSINFPILLHRIQLVSLLLLLRH
jgi:hypothetical protein